MHRIGAGTSGKLLLYGDRSSQRQGSRQKEMGKKERFSVLCRLIAKTRYMEGLHEVITRTNKAMLGITNVVVAVRCGRLATGAGTNK
jgi:hypothetical protein